MKVLLDENFPLGLVRVLQADGLHVEHIITLKIDVWRKAIASVAAAAQTTRVFELTDEGVLERWPGGFRDRQTDIFSVPLK